LIQAWIQENHKRLYEITKKLSKGIDTNDLFQLSVEELLINKNIHAVPDNEKFFYFARIVKNQYHSKTSKFHKIYRKHRFQSLDSSTDIIYEEYEEPVVSLEWVLEEIEKLKQKDWYLGQIFLLFLSKDANLTRTSEITGIPINNLSRDIKLVKGILHNKLKKKLESDGM
jgi:hypothetical protein